MSARRSRVGKRKVRDPEVAQWLKMVLAKLGEGTPHILNSKVSRNIGRKERTPLRQPAIKALPTRVQVHKLRPRLNLHPDKKTA
ncbi:hypothetical protein NDU88_007583 [Pleurodeles waltl]|uniref:Uncharacterized protein n=1 Tax=Pleurodeles waltl TaxID=8319 RepID=A0AAV7N2G6_PLEWA|nr:hypothetical protein NDU88_007583 [Pleurodeles waltl]